MIFVITNKRTAYRSLFLIPVMLMVSICGTTVSPADARLDDAPSVATAPDWSKGALFGRVLDTTTGKPLPDATVALQDKKGKILGWAKTNAEGQYMLAADSLTALQLRPSRRRGFLENLARGTGQVIAAPVKVVAGVVKQVDPVNTVKATVIASVTANPAPLAAEAVKTTGKAIQDQTTATARASTARSVMGERQAAPKEKRKDLVPGEVFLSVTAPGYKELKDKAGAYWLEPPTPASPDGKSPATGVRAWLETVKLAPLTAADKKCEVENNAVLLSEGVLNPAQVALGAPIKLSVKLATPGNQPLKIRVFARENRKRTVVELKPQDGAPGLFTGDMILDKEIGLGDTVVTIVALRAEPLEVNLKDNKEDPLLEFAKGLDDMEAGHSYEYDPRIMASENRLDLTLTVLDPKTATVVAPTTASVPLPSSTPSAPTAPAPVKPPL